MKFLFRASHNKAEYEALLAGVKLCHALEVDHLRVFSNSQLVVSRVKKEYEARDVIMVAYLSKVQDKSHTFKKFEIEHVPRYENR